MKKMYENMWSFMNPDMIRSIFSELGENIKITYRANVENDRFPRSFWNSICFKGSTDNGHYVYIDDKGHVYGTYELNLLARNEDDGICHGVAIAFAIDHMGPKRFSINEAPATRDDFKVNYIKILYVYKWLIERGVWDAALAKHFYNDVHWLSTSSPPFTQESEKALIELNKYIDKLRKL